jgi:hypothetical protein
MSGFVLLLVAGTVAVLTAAVLRPRVPRPVTTALLALAGGCLGAGALLVRDEPVNAVNWVATTLLSALFLPVHVWIAFGPPRAGART